MLMCPRISSFRRVTPTGRAQRGGYRLGNRVNELRVQADQTLSPSMIGQLEELEFVYNAPLYRWDEVIMQR
jgi:hypothetical protein